MVRMSSLVRSRDRRSRPLRPAEQLLWLLPVLLGLTSWLRGEETVDFNRDVRPILGKYCLACHGQDAQERQAGLRLDEPSSATSALESGATAIVPGDAEASEAIRRVLATGDERMPPASFGKQLSDRELATLSAWIRQGARFAQHWAFMAPRRPALPPVADSGWARHPIDRFVRTELDQRGMAPAEPASRPAWLRRVTLDLTGVPPAPEELDAFLADAAPSAFERVVDRLLASPRFGEHMARDWLDLARFADTHGYFTDHERYMWRWRDWVIQAYNDNLPFDQFTIEQLAGDLLPDPSRDQRVATGFNRNHMVTEETGVIPEEYRTEYVADRVRTTMSVWTGLTAGCAQCHDHKYDPLTQREFYQLFAYFNNLPEQGISGGRKNAAPLLDLATPEQTARIGELQAKIAALDKQLVALKSVQAAGSGTAADASPATAEADPGRREELMRERTALAEEQSRLSAATSVMVMQEMDAPRETFTLVRGQYDQLGERVTPGTPAFLPPLPDGAPANRLGLARWLVDPHHPLTSRVAVNRLWRHLFGRGLVATVEDFGVQGELPTHPALLDWLAVEFVESGWDVKQLIRGLVLSATYRQSSRIDAELLRRDAPNHWLARMSRYRLDAEVIRDSALAAAGLLVDRVGGPSVKPYQPADLWKHITYDTKNTQYYVLSTGEGLCRRSLYTYWKRQIPPPTMQLLDAPSRETCVLRRQRTNTPLQALALLNETQFVEAARELGRRMLEEASADRDRVRFGFRLVTARWPAEHELHELLALLGDERAAFRARPAAARELLQVGAVQRPVDDASELAAWTMLGNTLLNLDEFLTRE
ncbi:MAG: PSD1 and planctomycete cytochrome C domain-containing protein [Pirellulaceae bacterium]